MQMAGRRANITSAAGAPNRSVGCKRETQVRVVKLDHRKFGDVHSERRSTMTLPPLTAEVSLYKSSGHYRSASSTRRTSGIVPNQVLPQALTSYGRKLVTG